MPLTQVAESPGPGYTVRGTAYLLNFAGMT
jgi:hypothetical protein